MDDEMQFNNQICLYEKVTRMKKKNPPIHFHHIHSCLKRRCNVQLTFFFSITSFKKEFSRLYVPTNEPNHLGRSPYMVITQTITDGSSLLIIIKSDLIAQ